MVHRVTEELLTQLGRELKKNLDTVRTQAEEWFERPESGQHETIALMLEEVHGALSIIGQSMAADLARKISHIIVELSTQKKQPDQAVIDEIAVSILVLSSVVEEFVSEQTDSVEKNVEMAQASLALIESGLSDDTVPVDFINPQVSISSKTLAILKNCYLDQIDELIALLDRGGEKYFDQTVAQMDRQALNDLYFSFQMAGLNDAAQAMEQFIAILNRNTIQETRFDIALGLLKVRFALCRIGENMTGMVSKLPFNTYLAIRILSHQCLRSYKKVRGFLAINEDLPKSDCYESARLTMEAQALYLLLGFGQLAEVLYRIAAYFLYLTEHNPTNDDELQEAMDLIVAAEILLQELSGQDQEHYNTEFLESRFVAYEKLLSGDKIHTALQNIIDTESTASDDSEKQIADFDLDGLFAENDSEQEDEDLKNQDTESDCDDIAYDYVLLFELIGKHDLDHLSRLVPPEDKKAYYHADLMEKNDAEIQEIFKEELIELVSQLQEIYELWSSGDQGKLVDLRRIFHTLKGSGRMAQYESMGEFAWRQEELLNHVLDKKIRLDNEIEVCVRNAVSLMVLVVSNDAMDRVYGAMLLLAKYAEQLLAGKLADAGSESRTVVGIQDGQNNTGIDSTAEKVSNKEVLHSGTITSDQEAQEQLLPDAVIAGNTTNKAANVEQQQNVTSSEFSEEAQNVEPYSLSLDSEHAGDRQVEMSDSDNSETSSLNATETLNNSGDIQDESARIVEESESRADEESIEAQIVRSIAPALRHIASKQGDSAIEDGAVQDLIAYKLAEFNNESLDDAHLSSCLQDTFSDLPDNSIEAIRQTIYKSLKEESTTVSTTLAHVDDLSSNEDIASLDLDNSAEPSMDSELSVANGGKQSEAEAASDDFLDFDLDEDIEPVRNTDSFDETKSDSGSTGQIQQDSDTYHVDSQSIDPLQDGFSDMSQSVPQQSMSVSHDDGLDDLDDFLDFDAELFSTEEAHFDSDQNRNDDIDSSDEKTTSMTQGMSEQTGESGLNEAVDENGTDIPEGMDLGYSENAPISMQHSANGKDAQATINDATDHDPAKMAQQIAPLIRRLVEQRGISALTGNTAQSIIGHKLPGIDGEEEIDDAALAQYLEESFSDLSPAEIEAVAQIVQSALDPGSSSEDTFPNNGIQSAFSESDASNQLELESDEILSEQDAINKESTSEKPLSTEVQGTSADNFGALLELDDKDKSFSEGASIDTGAQIGSSQDGIAEDEVDDLLDLAEDGEYSDQLASEEVLSEGFGEDGYTATAKESVASTDDLDTLFELDNTDKSSSEDISVDAGQPLAAGIKADEAQRGISSADEFSGLDGLFDFESEDTFSGNSIEDGLAGKDSAGDGYVTTKEPVSSVNDFNIDDISSGEATESQSSEQDQYVTQDDISAEESRVSSESQSIHTSSDSTDLGQTQKAEDKSAENAIVNRISPILKRLLAKQGRSALNDPATASVIAYKLSGFDLNTSLDDAVMSHHLQEALPDIDMADSDSVRDMIYGALGQGHASSNDAGVMSQLLSEREGGSLSGTANGDAEHEDSLSLGNSRNNTYSFDNQVGIESEEEAGLASENVIPASTQVDDSSDNHLVDSLSDMDDAVFTHDVNLTAEGNAEFDRSDAEDKVEVSSSSPVPESGVDNVTSNVEESQADSDHDLAFGKYLASEDGEKDQDASQGLSTTRFVSGQSSGHSGYEDTATDAADLLTKRDTDSESFSQELAEMATSEETTVAANQDDEQGVDHVESANQTAIAELPAHGQEEQQVSEVLLRSEGKSDDVEGQSDLEGDFLQGEDSSDLAGATVDDESTEAAEADISDLESSTEDRALSDGDIASDDKENSVSLDNLGSEDTISDSDQLRSSSTVVKSVSGQSSSSAGETEAGIAAETDSVIALDMGEKTASEEPTDSGISKESAIVADDSDKQDTTQTVEQAELANQSEVTEQSALDKEEQSGSDIQDSDKDDVYDDDTDLEPRVELSVNDDDDGSSVAEKESVYSETDSRDQIGTEESDKASASSAIDVAEHNDLDTGESSFASEGIAEELPDARGVKSDSTTVTEEVHEDDSNLASTKDRSDKDEHEYAEQWASEGDDKELESSLSHDDHESEQVASDIQDKGSDTVTTRMEIVSSTDGTQSSEERSSHALGYVRPVYSDEFFDGTLDDQHVARIAAGEVPVDSSLLTEENGLADTPSSISQEAQEFFMYELDHWADELNSALEGYFESDDGDLSNLTEYLSNLEGAARSVSFDYLADCTRTHKDLIDLGEPLDISGKDIISLRAYISVLRQAGLQRTLTPYQTILHALEDYAKMIASQKFTSAMLETKGSSKQNEEAASSSNRLSQELDSLREVDGQNDQGSDALRRLLSALDAYESLVMPLEHQVSDDIVKALLEALYDVEENLVSCKVDNAIWRLLDVKEQFISSLKPDMHIDNAIVSLFGEGSRLIENFAVSAVNSMPPATEEQQELNRVIDQIVLARKLLQEGRIEELYTVSPEPAETQPASYGHDVAQTDASSEAKSSSIPLQSRDDGLIEIFAEEVEELLETVRHELTQDLESSDTQQKIQRAMHTLKGGARMVDLPMMADTAHLVESVVEKISTISADELSQTRSLLESALTALGDMLDSVTRNEQPLAASEVNRQIQSFLGGIGAEVPVIEQEESLAQENPVENVVDSEQAQSGQVALTEAGRHVRVSESLLDQLTSSIGEAGILQVAMGERANKVGYNLGELDRITRRIDEQLRRLGNSAESQILFRREQAESRDEDFDPLEMDRFSEIQQLTRQLSESVEDLRNIQQGIEDPVAAFHRLGIQQNLILHQVQEKLVSIQLISFDIHAGRLRRLVRQVAKDTGKKVDLIINGGHIELERSLLDDCLAPIEHIIRNAIAHGIEKPSERESAGKDSKGIVKVDVQNIANELVIRVIDDGKGIDYDAVRDSARAKGYLDESRQYDEAYLNSLLLQTGVTASHQVNQLSGRGIGMNVVSDLVRRRRGRLSIQSIAGQGTEMQISMPLGMSVADILMVEIASELYAVPMVAIRSIIMLDEALLASAEHDVYTYQDHAYRLLRLPDYFPGEREHSEGEQRIPGLIVSTGDGKSQVILQIDRVLNRMEVVVKDIHRQIFTIPGMMGASVMADGTVLPILDVPDLVEYMDSTHLEPVAAQKRVSRGKVMVVDDSVTMRKVGQRLLEKHDYEVATAKDGLDALEQLPQVKPDLILLDIEMPRMDGFEFAYQLRAQPQYANTPVIMITSRTGDKHRSKAKEVGIEHYLGKPYQEDDLLLLIEQLLEQHDGTR